MTAAIAPTTPRRLFRLSVISPLFTSILKSSLLMVGGLIAIMTVIAWLSQSLRFLDMIVNRGLSVGIFIEFTLLLIPSLVHFVLPLATFFGMLIAYHRLSFERELVIMQSIGLSFPQIARPGLWAAVFLAVICLANSVWLMPYGFRHFKDLQNEFRDNYSATLLQEGVFSEVAKGVTVFIRERGKTGNLLGILVHDNRSPKAKVTIIADEGQLIQSQGRSFVAVKNGIRQELNRSSGRMTMLYFKDYSVDLTQFRPPPAARWREPRERFLHELIHPSSSADDQRNLGAFRAELHQRFTMPILTLGFAILAMTSCIRAPHQRVASVRYLISICLVMTVIFAANLMLTNMAAKSSSYVHIMYLNAILPLLLSLRWLYDRSHHDSVSPPPLKSEAGT